MTGKIIEYNKLRDQITKILDDYTRETGERVALISVEKDIEDNYDITPVLGEPDYTEEARFELDS